MTKLRAFTPFQDMWGFQVDECPCENVGALERDADVSTWWLSSDIRSEKRIKERPWTRWKTWWMNTGAVEMIATSKVVQVRVSCQFAIIVQHYTIDWPSKACKVLLASTRLLCSLEDFGPGKKRRGGEVTQLLHNESGTASWLWQSSVASILNKKKNTTTSEDWTRDLEIVIPDSEDANP